MAKQWKGYDKLQHGLCRSSRQGLLPGRFWRTPYHTEQGWVPLLTDRGGVLGIWLCVFYTRGVQPRHGSALLDHQAGLWTNLCTSYFLKKYFFLNFIMIVRLDRF